MIFMNGFLMLSIIFYSITSRNIHNAIPIKCFLFPIAHLLFCLKKLSSFGFIWAWKAFYFGGVGKVVRSKSQSLYTADQ